VHDKNDPRYYRKYAHNVPPKNAYFFIPEKRDQVAMDTKTLNDRRVYFGWSNLTDYEREGIRALKSYIANDGCGDPPPSFTERDWLKWIQASHYDVAKAGPKLVTHIGWHRTVSPSP